MWLTEAQKTIVVVLDSHLIFSEGFLESREESRLSVHFNYTLQDKASKAGQSPIKDREGSTPPPAIFEAYPSSARSAPSPPCSPGKLLAPFHHGVSPAGLDVLCGLTGHLLVYPWSNTGCAHNTHTMHLDLSTLSSILGRAEFWHLDKICLISPQFPRKAELTIDKQHPVLTIVLKGMISKDVNPISIISKERKTVNYSARTFLQI